jgi:hypothetical protein
MRILLIIALLGWALPSGAEETVLPEHFVETFEGLAGLVDQETLSAMDMARGSYLSARYFSVGRPALPYLQSRFYGAQTPGEASMAGLYMTIYGGKAHTEAIRKELETNPRKRSWLYEMVGTESAYRASLDDGKQWKPLLRVLPSTAGSRQLAMTCMRSRDPLVRRAGLFWGYWMPDADYWRAVRRCGEGDRDPVTQGMARHLLRRDKVSES